MLEVMLITGASRGIGAATAALAAERGYDVAISYQRDSGAAESVAEQVRAHGALGGEPGRVDRLKSAVPMKRGGETAEIARAILWLASDESSYTTGSCLDAAGGR